MEEMSNTNKLTTVLVQFAQVSEEAIKNAPEGEELSPFIMRISTFDYKQNKPVILATGIDSEEEIQLAQLTLANQVLRIAEQHLSLYSPTIIAVWESSVGTTFLLKEEKKILSPFEV